MRTEINVETGEVSTIESVAYELDGTIVLIDDGDEIPQGAVRSADLPTPKPASPRLTSLEFLDLFQEAEQLAIVEASMQSAPTKLWYDRTLAASFVTIDDPRVSAGLTALVAANLLTEQRKGEIVAAMSA